jgi:zinc protease
LNRAKAALLAGYERAYKERETSESSNYANEYVRHFLQKEPIPGMEVEYKIAATYLPTITGDEISALAKELITEENRVVLGVAPEKKETPPPSTETMRAAIARAGTAPVERWAEATAGRELVEKPPAPGKVASRRTVPEIGATVLKLLERRRGVAQADRLQERSDSVRGLRAGRHVARAAAELLQRQPGHRDGWRGRYGRTESGRPQQDAGRQDRAGVAVDR